MGAVSVCVGLASRGGGWWWCCQCCGCRGPRAFTRIQRCSGAEAGYGVWVGVVVIVKTVQWMVKYAT